MKAKPVIRKDGEWVLCSVEEATHIELRLPGPLDYRLIPVIISGSRDKSERTVWTWNGDTEKPTLKPSVLTEGGRYSNGTEDDNMENWGEYIKYKCHTWITDGKATFLLDSNHDQAGKTVDLLDIVE